MAIVLDGEQLTAPLVIAPNLQAGIRLGKSWVTVGYSKRPGSEGRTRYRWEIIFPDNTDASGDDLQSGRQGGDLREGMESLLSFLAACGESYGWEMRNPGMKSENADLFPAPVPEWCYQNDSELSCAYCDLSDPDGE